MAMARACGIRTATTEIMRDTAAKRTRYHLFVERFDTIPGSSRRVHLMTLAGALHTHRLDYRHLLLTTRQLTRDQTEVAEAVRRMIFNVRAANADDHGKNHSFLFDEATAQWTLSPAYDLNPVPADLKARVLTTNIDLEEGTCSIDLLEASADYFALSLNEARAILKDVATTTSSWRTVARQVGATAAEIHRMATAFEHDSLRQALALP